MADIDAMSWPAICRHCLHLHDAGKVQVIDRYADCSTWRCPSCEVVIDDRPPSWGGCLTGEAVREAVARRDPSWRA